MTQFKKGDILVNGVEKRKVLGVCGDVLFVSYSSVGRSDSYNGDDYDRVEDYRTHNSLIEFGWKLEEREWEPEMNNQYYFPDFSSIDKYGQSNWDNDKFDNNRKNTVGVFPTAEEAIARYDEIIKLIKK